MMDVPDLPLQIVSISCRRHSFTARKQNFILVKEAGMQYHLAAKKKKGSMSHEKAVAINWNLYSYYTVLINNSH